MTTLLVEAPRRGTGVGDRDRVLFRPAAHGAAPADGTPAATLLARLKELVPGVPSDRIVDAWTSYGTPSAVAIAFFMHPHDGAVWFFERDVMPLTDFLDDYSGKPWGFVRACKREDLPSTVADIAETEGPEVAVRLVLQGLAGNQTAKTMLMKALQ